LIEPMLEGLEETAAMIAGLIKRCDGSDRPEPKAPRT